MGIVVARGLFAAWPGLVVALWYLGNESRPLFDAERLRLSFELQRLLAGQIHARQRAVFDVVWTRHLQISELFYVIGSLELKLGQRI